MARIIALTLHISEVSLLSNMCTDLPAMPMNTSIRLRNNEGTEIYVSAEQITPLGFQSEISHELIPDIRDESGRFRVFDICMPAETNDHCDVIGQCRVHSMRRVSADKSIICVRYENVSAEVYRSLYESEGDFTSMRERAPVLRHA
ncbi:hypothetical protein [Thalassolituus sp.]|uniref:hypothetical protein n=1 Tax=Thalassolituus sp. TaxID=2030822 RepID=UPI0035A3C78F